MSGDGLREAVEALADTWEKNAGADRDAESRTLREVAGYLRLILAEHPATGDEEPNGYRVSLDLTTGDIDVTYAHVPAEPDAGEVTR